MWGIGVSTTSLCENLQVKQRAAGVLGIPLEGPMHSLLADGLTDSELQCRAVAQKVPGMYGEELNCLSSG